MKKILGTVGLGLVIAATGCSKNIKVAAPQPADDLALLTSQYTAIIMIQKSEEAKTFPENIVKLSNEAGRAYNAAKDAFYLAQQAHNLKLGNEKAFREDFYKKSRIAASALAQLQFVRGIYPPSN